MRILLYPLSTPGGRDDGDDDDAAASLQKLPWGILQKEDVEKRNAPRRQ